MVKYVVGSTSTKPKIILYARIKSSHFVVFYKIQDKESHIIYNLVMYWALGDSGRQHSEHN